MYKYLDIEGARKTLAGRTVKFTRPLDFNDPFDIQLEELLGTESEQFDSEYKKALFAFLCGDIDYSKVPRDESGLKMYELNQALRSMTDDQRDTFRREVVERQYGEAGRLERLNATTLAGMQKSLEGCGVFCASDRCDSSLMWAHYAAKHTGVVLRFVPDAAKDSVLALAKPVIYSKERPLLYRTAEEMVRQTYLTTDDALGEEMMNSIVFTKSIEWEYENELRVIYPKLIGKGNAFRCVPFASNELTEVYFGCRIAQSDRDEISALAKAVNPDVRLYQAQTNKREYALEFFPV